jgi:sulfur-oxidizing protein SoxX
MRIIAAMTFVAALGAGSSAWAQAANPPLVKFDIRDGAIAQSLTGKKGDVQKGRQVVVNRQLGNCLACHEITALKSEPFHGNIAPSLDGVAGRLREGELRLRIVDGTKLNAETMMPPFYRADGLNKVMKRFEGKTILTAEQVEDVVAYLETLK